MTQLILLSTLVLLGLPAYCLIMTFLEDTGPREEDTLYRRSNASPDFSESSF